MPLSVKRYNNDTAGLSIWLTVKSGHGLQQTGENACSFLSYPFVFLVSLANQTDCHKFLLLRSDCGHICYRLGSIREQCTTPANRLLSPQRIFFVTNRTLLPWTDIREVEHFSRMFCSNDIWGVENALTKRMDSRLAMMPMQLDPSNFRRDWSRPKLVRHYLHLPILIQSDFPSKFALIRPYTPVVQPLIMESIPEQADRLANTEPSRANICLCLQHMLWPWYDRSNQTGFRGLISELYCFRGCQGSTHVLFDTLPFFTNTC